MLYCFIIIFLSRQYTRIVTTNAVCSWSYWQVCGVYRCANMLFWAWFASSEMIDSGLPQN